MTQLLLHREDKPSVLDMSEAVIARLQEKAGAPKDKILKVTSPKQRQIVICSNFVLFQEILSEFTNVIEDPTKVTAFCLL